MIKKIFMYVTAVMLAFMFALSTPADCYAAGNIALDVSTYKNIKSKTTLTKDRTLGNGAMSFKIPSDWTTVEDKLTNIDGYSYRLNEIQNQAKPDAEHLFVFYFSNEKWLDNQSDAGKREGIEQAIIKNILPGENFSALNIDGLSINFPTARKGKDGQLLGGIKYDYYDTTYTDKNRKKHNAEFVFLPNGTKGMCCVLYVFTDSVHKDDIITMLHEIKTK